MCPIEYTATNSATPWASPMTPSAAAVDPNPSANLVAVMGPGPTRVRRNFPEAYGAFLLAFVGPGTINDTRVSGGGGSAAAARGGVWRAYAVWRLVAVRWLVH